MKINLPKVFSQNDPQWKNKTLGTKGTIGAYGCLMTCATMMLNWFGKNETPDTLNEKLKINGGYVNGNLFVWGAINKIYSDVKYQGQIQTPDALTKTQMDFIKSKIDIGFPVILQIDTIPQTAGLDEHWILVVDYDGDDFIVADPWDGAIKRITSWGVQPQKLIYAYAYYSGNPSKPVETKPTITIDGVLYEHLVDGATVRKAIAEYLEIANPDNASKDEIIRVIAGYKSRITDTQRQLIDAQTAVKNREEQVSRLKDQLTKEQDLRTELNKTLTDTLEKQGGIAKVYEDRLSQMQGQIDTLAKEKGQLNEQIAELQKKANGEVEVGNILIKIWNKIKTWKI